MMQLYLRKIVSATWWPYDAAVFAFGGVYTLTTIWCNSVCVLWALCNISAVSQMQGPVSSGYTRRLDHNMLSGTLPSSGNNAQVKATLFVDTSLDVCTTLYQQCCSNALIWIWIIWLESKSQPKAKAESESETKCEPEYESESESDSKSESAISQLSTLL